MLNCLISISKYGDILKYFRALDNRNRATYYIAYSHQGCICVCVASRHSPAWLPLYKARLHFIEPFGAPADQRSSLTRHQGTQIQVSVPRRAPLEVTTSWALLGRGISMDFP